ncbi:tetratricopeptide repeat protein [Pollutibacter soli]|uniref:tetratricopeptide repeat protein n=1 Tax=Pollutibacter soli TaxID=3034157 RepID=UPI003013745D
MSEKKVQDTEQDELVRSARGFWEKNSKLVLIISSAIIVLAGGYLGYKYFIQLPKEEKAQEEIFKAEAYFRKDSLSLALNGDVSTSGFLKMIKKYDGTKTGNLAKLYAGECYLQLGDFNNAVKYLKDFNANGAKQVEAKVAGLLGDAYSELKKSEEAISSYKKAGTLFEYDQSLSSEYLFRAGLLSELSGKTKEAAEMYKQIKEKYPKSEKGFLVDKYLARLGVNE